MVLSAGPVSGAPISSLLRFISQGVEFIPDNPNYLVVPRRAPMVFARSSYGTKRLLDSVLWDIVCTNLMFPTDIIAVPVTVTVDQDDSELEFGVAVINSATQDYSDGNTAPIGQVIQIRVSGGAIALGQDDLDIGVPNALYTVRFTFDTELTEFMDASVQFAVINDLVG